MKVNQYEPVYEDGKIFTQTTEEDSSPDNIVGNSVNTKNAELPLKTIKLLIYY